MNRYIKQRNDYYCGPIAVINAAKYYKIKSPQYGSQWFYRLIRKSGCTTKKGSWGWLLIDMDLGVRLDLVAFNKIKKPSVVIIMDTKHNLHATLCIDQTKRKMKMVNCFKGEKNVAWVDKKLIKSIFVMAFNAKKEILKNVK